MIEEILKYNAQFVAEKEYENYVTSGQPNRKLAVLSCMDTRLTELLPKAMGLKNGDAKFIKVAGGTMLSPYDSVIRSLLVAVYELECGLCRMKPQHFFDLMKQQGISDESMQEAAKHVDIETFFSGFEDVEEDVKLTVTTIKQHPLMPQSVTVRGFVIDSHTGKLTEVL